MRALVIEGGGMKAAYANGVLAAFEEAGFTAFDAVIGTSAGGALAAWFSAGQAGYALDTWQYVQDQRIMSYKRYLLGRGPLLDHDQLFSTVYEDEMPLALKAVRNAPHPVIVTATNAETARVHYQDVREGDVLAWLRATGRLPLGTGPAVEIDGQRWLDGGLAVPVPVQHAFELGADDVVCVLNNPAIERTPEPWFVAKLVARSYPAVEQLARDHHRLHNENVALAESPPEGTHVDIVRPAAPLSVGRLTRDLARIEAAIEQGRADGYAYLADPGDHTPRA